MFYYSYSCENKSNIINVKVLEMSLHVFVAYLTGRGNLLLFTVEEIHLIVTESLIKIYALIKIYILLTETLWTQISSGICLKFGFFFSLLV